jgi:hypothetical protein
MTQLSRAAETARFRERNEVFQPFQFHARPAAGEKEEVSILVGVAAAPALAANALSPLRQKIGFCR